VKEEKLHEWAAEIDKLSETNEEWVNDPLTYESAISELATELINGDYNVETSEEASNYSNPVVGDPETYKELQNEISKADSVEKWLTENEVLA